jgi:hypothetical protein
MLRIEEIVTFEATWQGNGRWVFEGKDTHSWLGEAEQYRKAYEGEMNLDRLGILDELYMISAVLQRLDNADDNM